MGRIEKLIFEQAELHSDAIAIEYNGSRLSYLQLMHQSLQVSRALKELGLTPGASVGIYKDRSLDTIPCMLGIWHAGGVAVPINPEAPVKMLESIITDSSLRIIITVRALRDRITHAVINAGPGSLPTVLTDGHESDSNPAGKIITFLDIVEMEADSSANIEAQESDCYIIYTSGSEGRPKGVIGTHESLEHYLKWQAKEFSITRSDRFSQVAPLSFDFSLKEIFVPLICGATVCIADRSTVIDPSKFIRWVDDYKITVACCVPTLLRSILQLSSTGNCSLKSLRHLLISGEMLRWEDVINWRNRFGSRMSLFNLYGPTESTVIKLFYPIPESRNSDSACVPIGKPIDGAEALILDGDRQCSQNETGEIVILSDWIARGYLNNGKTGDQSFGRILYKGNWTRAYRTGDLGRRLSDGNIELVGRKDRQIKIRGYRIELDEIESILAEHPGVQDAAALVSRENINDGGEALPLIICYFTAASSRITEEEIRDYAKPRLLPQVLSALRFSILDKLPLSANGKVDRLALASLAQASKQASIIEISPTDLPVVQERMLAVWAELLALKTIDSESSFFELGGDSLMVIRLLRRLREEMHPQIKLEDIYDYPSVSRLAIRVRDLINRAEAAQGL